VYRYEINHDQTGGGPGDCPNVVRIGFSHNALLNDETMKITAHVTVADPQGLGDIDWVRMTSLIDYGRETAPWDEKGRAPLSSGGDPGDAQLSDTGPAGELGDEVAGDGVYTFDGFKTRSYSSFWAHYASAGFPIKVPMRVIVKDKSDNYAIVDTQLTVTNNAADIAGPDDPNDGGDPNDAGDPNDGGDPNDTGDTNDNGTGDTNGDPTASDDGNDNANGDSTSDGTSSDPNDNGLGGGPSAATGGLCPTTSAVLLSLSVVTLLRKRRRHD
jgi:hypothetical protein